MPFKPERDSIAITIPLIRLRRNVEGLLERNTRRENELYYVSVALDAVGTRQKQLNFGHSYWPAIRRFEEVQMTGHGALVYGPKNPGAYVAYSILFLESDADMRERGARAKSVIADAGKAFDLGSVLPSLKVGAAALAMAQGIMDFVASRLASDRDDELMRLEGVHFRDWVVPYNVNRRFVHKNKWLEVHDHVLPLPQANGEALETETVGF